MNLKFKSRSFFVSFLVLLIANVQAKVMEYNIDIEYKTVNYTGNAVQAMTIGGGIPGPTIKATVGDTLRVTFNNKMDVETSIHWHGILLPNDQDGVPYLTTQPIKSGTSFTFEYPIIHSGTYWYHSHTGLQEQRGVYGSLVFYPQEQKQSYDKEHVLVLSDWTNENPKQVLANLKKDGDYYALKKDSVQSWIKVIQHGKQAIKNRLQGSWTRMGPMDISDVGYDAFLINGEEHHNIGAVKPGSTILLRIINAGASSYFNVEFSAGDMTVVAADGVDVEPFEVDRLRLAIAETFDVAVTIPDDKSYEFRATAEDGTGHASAIIGEGELVAAKDIPRPNLFLVDHSMHGMHDMDEMDHSQMHHDPMITSNRMKEYEQLRSPIKTALPGDNPTREVMLRLTGNMERYVWEFNNKTLSESDKILIKKGENVRFTLVNTTMMHHPIHLHGHFFRVINGQGEHSPLKHTVNVPPMETVVIEFLANEEKDWFFHCHNLYHMKAGMSRVISYQDTANRPIPKELMHDSWYLMGHVGVHTNMLEGHFRPSNTRNAIDIEFDYNYDDEYEIEAIYERSITRFLELYAGGEFEKEDEETENKAVFGFHYVLPMLIELDARVNSEGEFRLGLESELQLTDRLAFEWKVNTEVEYRLVLDYEVTKSLSLSANYDSDYDVGAGLKLRF